MSNRLSTCAVCGGTIECRLSVWAHVADLGTGYLPHFAEPDDSAVSGPGCEVERALDEDADAYAERARD